MTKNRIAGMAGAIALAIAGFATSAQAQVDINARIGAAVPTGDAADIANSGLDFGGGIAFWLSPRIAFRTNVDFSSHDLDADTDGPGLDIFHIMAGLGYLLTTPGDPFYFSVNAGAGFMSFSPEETTADSDTEFGINAGAELGYWLSPNISVFASPQGNIAFTDEDEVGSSTLFVWPFTAGLKVRL